MLATVLALAMMSPDFGQKGRDLVNQCTIPANVKGQVMDVSNFLMCGAYLQGFVESDSGLCIPNGVSSGGDLAEVIVKYGRDHPERLYIARSNFTREALLLAYPCPAK